MDVPEKTAYTARVTSTGGRAGHAISDDGSLDIILTDPRSAGARPEGTTAEELFAAALAACFNEAVTHVAAAAGLDSSGSTVTATVRLGASDESYALSVLMEVAVPGQDLAMVQDLADRAYQICPYSRALRGNVPLEVRAITG